MPGMRENRVKNKLEEGKVATVAVGLNDPDTIEFLGQFGFDGMWIETEHAPTTGTRWPTSPGHATCGA